MPGSAACVWWPGARRARRGGFAREDFFFGIGFHRGVAGGRRRICSAHYTPVLRAHNPEYMRPEKTPFVSAHLLGVAQRVHTAGLNVNQARHAHLRWAFNLSQHLVRTHSCFTASNGYRPLHLEFGVRNGASITALSNFSGGSAIVWDGFDSFRGLPDQRNTRHRVSHWTPGQYSTQGHLPAAALLPTVRLHAGWFNDSVPQFLASPAGRGVLAFAHLDADLYESTRVVLDALASRCRLCAGSVLAFDELFGSPTLEQQEWRALREAALKFGLTFRFVSYMAHEQSSFGRAAVQITGVRPCQWSL